MYEYKFVKIDLTTWASKPKEDYHEVIAEHAREGWRFIQIFAPATSGYGSASYFEIIFERPRT
ncbi:DUF4177 domain-containing protein [Halalkalibacter krulwichiae]|uniref:DUF4177 domain-containing protein n=1 Tax=Halalkalibacter krulwichiae TaxID=199441 RepID=A0A1X9MGF0_9BACI|nr:DUF4177 domain-containing protein [Halalkalibacter krulwichiae]ARK32496.1 hypothetical protein BkAM31D_22975 [Halalkalibacter krulwichiae]